MQPNHGNAGAPDMRESVPPAIRHRGTYDVAIVGAGVIGAMIARELSKYRLRVVLIEKESDVAAETSSANSGIVHAGYDAEPGTVKARLNVEGTRLMPQVARELDVPFHAVGSLVLAFDAADETKLARLLDHGRRNGVPELRILPGDAVRAMEPAISPAVVSALHAPTAGIVCPYQLTVGATENAVANGVTLLRSWPVRRIRRIAETGDAGPLAAGDGEAGRTHLAEAGEAGRSLLPPDGASDSSSPPRFLLMSDAESLSARFVVNAAGLFADEVAAMVGDLSFRIHPRKGEYLLLDKTLGRTVRSVVFQTPGPMGKGILVTPTADGNLLLGPNAQDVPDKEDTETTFDGLRAVSVGARRSVPGVDTRAVIRSFAGLRAATAGGDFLIGPSQDVEGFFHVAGIDSPGLSSAPAIALAVCRGLGDIGLPLAERPDWNPLREKVRRFAEMDAAQRARAVAADPRFGHIVCRCETVTEAEIVDAIRRPAGAITLDGLKRRTRAGMGRCQGGFCTPRAVDILARELGISPDAVTKRGTGSNILAGPSKPEACPVRRPRPADAPAAGAGAPGTINGRVAAPASVAPLWTPPDTPPPARVSLAVIGGGPAGLAAAIEAKKNGIADVVILEREREPGGILGQCIHPGFGLHLFGEELTGPEYASRFIRQASEWGIPIYADTMVLDLGRDRRITAISSRYGHFTLEADAVVLAMGCRERAAGALSIPGARPAGIMTAGSAQRFINMEGYLPGRRVVILGSGDIGLIMARRLTLEGAEVPLVCEVLPYAGGLTRNIVQCLDDFGIPLKLSHTVVGLHGRDRLAGVTVARVDENRMPVPGTEFDVTCDTLLLSVGLIPENELSRAAGVPLDAVTGGPSVSMDMQTGVPGIFACGNVVHVHDLVDHVSEEGRLAGRCAAAWLKAGGIAQAADAADLADRVADFERSAIVPEIPVLAGTGVRYVLPRSVRMDGLQPESRLLFRVAEPARHVVLEVRAGDTVLVSMKKMRVAPGEMESVPLKAEWLARVPAGAALAVHVVPGAAPAVRAGAGTAAPAAVPEEACAVAPAAGTAVPASPAEMPDLAAIRCFALDMDGTFYLGDSLLETSAGFLDKLHAQGRQFLFFTNNSSKSPADYLAKLARMGIAVEPGQMMTSGDVAVSFLLRERAGKTVFLLGTPSLRAQFREAGIRLIEPAPGWAPAMDAPRADIVMVGFDTTLQYDALSQACWHIRGGAEFLATHLDWNCPVEGGFIPDCGAMCALVEASTGKKPRFLGKPFAETMEAVLERTGARRETVAFVGDRLYTDVATGVNNGASGILVLTGEAGLADIASSDVKPTWVFPSLRELGEALG